MRKDQGMSFLQENLSRCADASKAKVSRKWILFKTKLRKKFYIDEQYFNIGIMPLNEAMKQKCN